MISKIAQPVAVTPPNRHHYVPKFLSEQFRGAAGTVRAWFKDHGIVRDVQPKDLFVVGQYHARYERDGTRDPSLEIHLSRLEGVAAPVLQDIIDATRANRGIEMDTERKAFLDLFVYLQFRRVPDRFATYKTEMDFEEVLRRSMDEWKDRFPHRAGELEGMDSDEVAERIFHNSRIQAIRDFRGPALREFGRRSLDVVIIAPHLRRQFVLGSNPVVAFDGLVADGVAQLWLPIAPDIAIGPGPIGNEVRQIEIGDRNTIRRFNLAVCAQSTIVASASDRLLQSLRQPK